METETKKKEKKDRGDCSSCLTSSGLVIQPDPRAAELWRRLRLRQRRRTGGGPKFGCETAKKHEEKFDEEEQ